MEDPNLPPDPAATTGGGVDGRPRRLKKLPAPQGDTGAAAPAADTAAGDPGGAPRPRRKKKRPPAGAGAGAASDASPDHGTAPISAQQQLLPAPTAGDQEEAANAAGTSTAGGAAPKPRRKKRRQPAAAGAAAADAAEGEEARRSPEGREADPGAAGAAAQPQTRYIDVEGMPLAKALETVRADVVTRQGAGGRVNFGADLADGGPAGEANADDDDTAGVGGGGRAGESNMSDTIFWQTQDARTFKAEKLDKYQQRLEQERKEREQYLEGVEEEDTSNRTLKCAIGFTKVYNYLGTVLLGLMPGFAILHAYYVWTLSSNYLQFLADYSSLGAPMPILYYVTLTLILLSVLDRYDTGKLDRTSCLECASFRHAGMVALLYVPAYVVSNAMYPTDQWIRAYTLNATAYAGIAEGNSLVQSWRVMDAVRAACLTLGWLVVAFNPQFNKLAANLETELDDLIGEDQQLELGAGGTQAGRTMAGGTMAGGRTMPATTRTQAGRTMGATTMNHAVTIA